MDKRLNFFAFFEVLKDLKAFKSDPCVYNQFKRSLDF